MSQLPTMHSMLPAMAVIALPALAICLGISVMVYRRWRRDRRAT